MTARNKKTRAPAEDILTFLDEISVHDGIPADIKELCELKI